MIVPIPHFAIQIQTLLIELSPFNFSFLFKEFVRYFGFGEGKCFKEHFMAHYVIAKLELLKCFLAHEDKYFLEAILVFLKLE